MYIAQRRCHYHDIALDHGRGTRPSIGAGPEFAPVCKPPAQAPIHVEGEKTALLAPTGYIDHAVQHDRRREAMLQKVGTPNHLRAALRPLTQEIALPFESTRAGTR
jgi:hypothetical protein